MKKSLIPLLIVNLLPLSFSCGKLCGFQPCVLVDIADPDRYDKNEYLECKTAFKLTSFKSASLEYKYKEYCNCEILYKTTTVSLFYVFENTKKIYDIEARGLINDDTYNDLNSSFEGIKLDSDPYLFGKTLNYSLVGLSKKEKERVLNEIKEHESKINEFFNSLDFVYSLQHSDINYLINTKKYYKNPDDNNLILHVSTFDVAQLIPFRNNKCVIDEYYSLLKDAIYDHDDGHTFNYFYEDFGTDFTEEEFLTKLGLN
ncbi:MAG: hypothetical protein IJ656_01535 [Bacilli bacterium]|nr:hypothetical protein [Bacilli bacterium]